MSSDARLDVEGLRARLAASRVALLEAVTGLTEREFSRSEPGDPEGSIAQLLARLARDERAAVQRARALAGLEERRLPSAVGAGDARVLPPQAIHDLAGARHEAQLALEALAGLAASGAAIGLEVSELLEGCAARELEAAGRIAARARPASD